MGHCTNCHADFDPTTGNQLCPPCARAYVMGLNAAGGGDLHASYRSGWDRGFEQGASAENDRLRQIFLWREELGMVTFADVVQAIWPEEE